MAQTGQDSFDGSRWQLAQGTIIALEKGEDSQRYTGVIQQMGNEPFLQYVPGARVGGTILVAYDSPGGDGGLSGHLVDPKTGDKLANIEISASGAQGAAIEVSKKLAGVTVFSSAMTVARLDGEGNHPAVVAANPETPESARTSSKGGMALAEASAAHDALAATTRAVMAPGPRSPGR